MNMIEALGIIILVMAIMLSQETETMKIMRRPVEEIEKKDLNTMKCFFIGVIVLLVGAVL